MTLAACIVAHEAAHCLPAAIASVLGHVDKVCVAVDDRTDSPAFRATMQWLEASADHLKKFGLEYWNYTFTYATGNEGSYNGVKDRAGTDWAFIIDADEVVDPHHMVNLRTICTEAEHNGVDLVGFCRRNWWDIARAKCREEWWPDHQWRLSRPHVRYKWRVHSALVGYHRNTVADPSRFVLHHYNLAYRTHEEWANVSAFYDELMALDKAEGRIP